MSTLTRPFPAMRMTAARSTLRLGGFLPGSVGVLALVVGATWAAPAWIMMGCLAATLFLELKWATLRFDGRLASSKRVAAYVLLWPGMNARQFLSAPAGASAGMPRAEVIRASAKFVLGLVLTVWAVRHAATAPPLVVAWIGMIGLIFTFHFGAFHLLSCGWRARGVDARPIMRAPIAARSLAEFWGERWNVAFAESARRLVLRPLGRRWGAAPAGAFVFLLSGLVHEIVISLPARGGWGGPTLYFLLQGAGVAFEKTDFARRRGLCAGVGGRLWMCAVTALPLPLLFHAPFAERVIVPMLRFLQEAL